MNRDRNQYYVQSDARSSDARFYIVEIDLANGSRADSDVTFSQRSAYRH